MSSCTAITCRSPREAGGGRLGSPGSQVVPGCDSTHTRLAWSRPAKQIAWEAQFLRAETMAAVATLSSWSGIKPNSPATADGVFASMTSFSSYSAAWLSKFSTSYFVCDYCQSFNEMSQPKTRTTQLPPLEGSFLGRAVMCPVRLVRNSVAETRRAAIAASAAFRHGALKSRRSLPSRGWRARSRKSPRPAL